jgi:hypothetical protein
MRPSLTGFFSCIAISLTSIAYGISSTAHANPPASAVHRSSVCDGNTHVDPSVQVCIAELDGTVQYLIDTVDGTHAEFSISDSGVTLQQSGPDTVRVLFDKRQHHLHDDSTLYYGVSKMVYQDAMLSITEVQNGQQAPTWIISITPRQDDAPFKAICNRTDCGGTIQQR